MGNYMRKIETSEHAKIVKLYSTHSAADIGAKYGVSHQAVLDILRKHKVAIRKNTERPGAKNGRSRNS